MTCCLCLEPFSRTSLDNNIFPERLKKCGHVLHNTCYSKYLKASSKRYGSANLKEKLRCPYCNSLLMKDI